MGFYEELTAPEPGKSRCGVAAIKDKLSTQDAAGLTMAVNSEIPASVLSTRLRGLGHPISASTVLRHRSGQCRCIQAKAEDAFP